MKHHLQERDWEVIHQNLRQEKNLNTKDAEKLRFFMKLFGTWSGQDANDILCPFHYGD